MSDKHNNALIIFTRVPIPGKTKTRMETCLSKQDCANLHINMLKDLNKTKNKVEADIYVYYTPSGDHKILESIFDNIKKFSHQIGSNLWDKSYQAMIDVKSKGYDKIILIGSDIPEISNKHINRAFNMLEYTDIVLTPTQDQGYCLLGMKEIVKSIICIPEIPYGSSVINEVIKSCISGKYSFFLNKSLVDLDEEKDLKYLSNNANELELICKNTLEFLIKMGY